MKFHTCFTNKGSESYHKLVAFVPNYSSVYRGSTARLVTYTTIPAPLTLKEAFHHPWTASNPSIYQLELVQTTSLPGNCNSQFLTGHTTGRADGSLLTTLAKRNPYLAQI